MKLVFDTNGNDKQKECVKAWNDPNVIEITYGGSKGSAKSFTGCSLIFGDALMYPKTHYFIARKVLKDLRAFTIPSIHEVFDLWGLDKDLYLKYNGQDSFFTLPNESRIYLLDAKHIPSDPDYARFGSMQFTRGWIEEAGEFELKCKQHLQASTGRKMNKEYGLSAKLIQTCNPSKNYLYSDFKKNREGTLEPHKAFIQAFPEDNKMLGDQYLENLHKVLTGAQKERLLYGNWDYDDDPAALTDWDSICDIFTNEHVPGGTKYISADLAMQGRDKFIAGHWDGLIGHVDIDMAKSTGKSIELSLKQLKIEKGVQNSNIVADADGLGNYIESYIENIKAFHGNQRAMDAQYANIKAECGFKLAEYINQGKIRVICTDEQKEAIKEELSVCLKRDKIDADNQKKRLIPKDKMKELLGHSPDYLDWMLMRMIFELYVIELETDWN